MTEMAERRNIGPDEARELLALNTANRDISAFTLTRYVNDMQGGLWRFNGEPIILAVSSSGALRLLDGQHRLQAVVRSGCTVPFLVVTLAAEDGISVDDVFSTINQGKTRSLRDYMRTSIEGASLSSTGLRALVAGIQGLLIVDFLISTGHNRFSTMTLPQRIQHYQAHRDDAEWAAGVRIDQPKSLQALPAGVLAAGIAMHRVVPVETDTFFRSVLTGEMLRSVDPAYALRQALISRAVAQQATNSDAANHAWYGLTLAAWRAYCEGRDVVLLRPLKAPYSVSRPRVVAR